MKSGPCLPQLEKVLAQKQRPNTAKNLKIYIKIKLQNEKKEKKKQMEQYTMFLDWKNQYCQNYYTTQSNLQIP